MARGKGESKSAIGRQSKAGRPPAGEIVTALRRAYPDAGPELLWKTPLQLLVATILSAQCTDERVNQVTRKLFARYRTAADYASADPARFEQEIRPTGFYRNKTKLVLGAARRLVDDFGGEVPAAMADLLTLPGVARKTANLVLGTAFGKAAGVVVDTHVKRVAYRLGLTDEQDPGKVEADLMVLLPQNDWIFAGFALILHGRRVCQARVPRCSACPLADLCPQRGVERSE
jgi:endonuclease III